MRWGDDRSGVSERRGRARCAVVLLWTTVAVMCAQSLPVESLPFSATSGVTELTPATLGAFLQTHKPVYIMFYAPWCGHCKSMHPEWERFAKATKGTARVGAVNADQHTAIAQQVGIKGFPTIKYWKMAPPGGKERKLSDAGEYQSQRSAAALQAHMTADVRSDRVKEVATADALRDLVRSAALQKVAVLFSNKGRVPPLFSVLSYSTVFDQKLPFVFVGEKAGAGTAGAFAVSEFPTLAVISLDAGGGDAALTTVPFTGKIEYVALGNFFRSSLSLTAAELAANSGGTTGSAAAAEEVASDVKARKPARAALPVRPKAWVPSDLVNFCAAQIDVAAQPPLCVLSFPASLPLEPVHAMFANEPVLFFYAHDRYAELAPLLAAHFAVEGLTEESVVLLRGSKRDVVRHKVLGDVAAPEELTAALQRALSGELRFTTSRPDMGRVKEEVQRLPDTA